MEQQGTATVSARWMQPERSPEGTYWRARLRRPETAPITEREACGPDEAACAREADRLDHEWTARYIRAVRERATNGGDTQ
jgi:hypothetical protein